MQKPKFYRKKEQEEKLHKLFRAEVPIPSMRLKATRKGVTVGMRLEMLKDMLYNNLSTSDVSKKYNVSVQTAQRIIR